MAGQLVPGLAVRLGSEGDLSVLPGPAAFSSVVTKRTSAALVAVALVVAAAPSVATLAPVLPASVLPASTTEAALLQQPLVVLHQLTHLVRQLQRQSLNTARLGPKQNELANKTKDFRLRLSDNLQA